MKKAALSKDCSMKGFERNCLRNAFRHELSREAVVKEIRFEQRVGEESGQKHWLSGGGSNEDLEED